MTVLFDCSVRIRQYRLFSPPRWVFDSLSLLYFPSGGEIDCVDKYGNTPLHVAAKYGHELLISTLMTNGADTARYRKSLKWYH